MTAAKLASDLDKRGPKNPKWGEERITRIKGYLADGLSYELIAREMNTTRNGISGAVYRLGLSDKTSPRRPSVTKRATTSAGRPRRKPATEPRIKFVPALVPTEATEIAADFVPPNPVRLLDLQPWNCRFPLGEPSEMLFCGDPIARRNYCVGHAHLCFKPSSGPKPWVPGRVA